VSFPHALLPHAGFRIWNNLGSRGFEDLLRDVVLPDVVRLWTAGGGAGQELKVRHPPKPNKYHKGELLEKVCAELLGVRLVG
jgi:hypothetical protein